MYSGFLSSAIEAISGVSNNSETDDLKSYMCRVLKFKDCLALFEEYPCQQKSPSSAAQGNGACGCLAVWLCACVAGPNH